MLPSPDVRRPPSAAAGDVCAAGAGAVDARRGERGAVLVHAAVAMAGLLAFSALTIDLGSVWVIRAQAQNAADAAALAGTISLAYGDPSDTAAARAAALAIVQQHRVWGGAIPPAATSVADTCPPGAPAVPGACLGVRVGLGAGEGTPLPTFFAGLIGGTAANVHASAVGKVMPGNSTSCLRPLAIADSWSDSVAPSDLFNGYNQEGTAVGPTDGYVPPSSGGTGTGITVASMYGRSIVRRFHNPFSETPLPADALLVYDLPRPGSDGELDIDWVWRLHDNLASCSGLTHAIGATVPSFRIHNNQNYTGPPLQALIDDNPDADWNEVSPRVITIGVFDPQAFSQQWRVPPPGDPPRPPNVPVVLRNFVGLYLQSVRFSREELEITGIVVPVPGQFDQRAPTITADAAFLRSVALVR